MRFNEFRLKQIRQSFRNIVNADVVDFLVDQKTRFLPPDWQLNQAQDSVVLFLRQVIGLENIDARQVSDFLPGGDDRSVGGPVDVPVIVDESRPEWYQLVQRSLLTCPCQQSRGYVRSSDSIRKQWTNTASFSRFMATLCPSTIGKYRPLLAIIRYSLATLAGRGRPQHLCPDRKLRIISGFRLSWGNCMAII